MDYKDIIDNPNKTLTIEKNSVDSWRLGEMIGAINYDKKNSQFEISFNGLDTRIDSGYVLFNNNCKVEII